MDDVTSFPDWMATRPKRPDRYDPMSNNPSPFSVGETRIVPLPHQPVYVFDRHLISLISEEPFYSRMSQRIPKIATSSIPTACVAYFDGEFRMFINPEFIRRYDEAGKTGPIKGLFVHEFSHVHLGHLTHRMLEGNMYPNLSNICQDLAINSLRIHDQKGELPGSPMLPGLRPGMPMDPAFDVPDPMNMHRLVNIPPDEVEQAIMDAPILQTSEFYYALLKPLWTFTHEGTSWGTYTDLHGVSDGPMDQAAKEIAKDHLRNLLKEAAEYATNKGWGSVSARMQKEIREFINPIIDWRQELAEWTGTNFSADDKSSTFTRIHRRYPNSVPGKKRNRGLNIALCVDQSASVDDSLLLSLFSEANAMAEMASVTVIPFDTQVYPEKIKKFSRGDRLQVDRVACGGTNFEAATQFVNSDDARDEFDVVWMLTDGECSKPSASRIPRCWLIAPNRKLLFTTDERVITMTLPTLPTST